MDGEGGEEEEEKGEEDDDEEEESVHGGMAAAREEARSLGSEVMDLMAGDARSGHAGSGGEGSGSGSGSGEGGGSFAALRPPLMLRKTERHLNGLVSCLGGRLAAAAAPDAAVLVEEALATVVEVPGVGRRTLLQVFASDRADGVDGVRVPAYTSRARAAEEMVEAHIKGERGAVRMRRPEVWERRDGRPTMVCDRREAEGMMVVPWRTPDLDNLSAIVAVERGLQAVQSAVCSDALAFQMAGGGRYVAPSQTASTSRDGRSVACGVAEAVRDGRDASEVEEVVRATAVRNRRARTTEEEAEREATRLLATAEVRAAVEAAFKEAVPRGGWRAEMAAVGTGGPRPANAPWLPKASAIHRRIYEPVLQAVAAADIKTGGVAVVVLLRGPRSPFVPRHSLSASHCCAPRGEVGVLWPSRCGSVAGAPWVAHAFGVALPERWFDRPGLLHATGLAAPCRATLLPVREPVARMASLVRLLFVSTRRWACCLREVARLDVSTLAALAESMLQPRARRLLALSVLLRPLAAYIGQATHAVVYDGAHAGLRSELARHGLRLGACPRTHVSPTGLAPVPRATLERLVEAFWPRDAAVHAAVMGEHGDAALAARAGVEATAGLG